MTIGCPACGVQITPPVQTCGGCGLRLVGAEAARLWQIETTMAALTAERTDLLRKLREPAPDAWAWAAAPRPSLAAFEPRPYPRTEINDPFVRERATPRREVSPQQLLLGLGAALLLVASIVFVAVAWNDLGLVVQAVIMAGFTVGTAWASAIAVQRRLKATAESLGVVASGLVAIDCWAFWRLDAFHVQQMSPAAYTAVSALIATLLVATASKLIPQVKAFGIVSVLSAQAPVVAAVIAVAAHGHQLAVLLAAAAVGMSGIDRVLAPRLPVQARATARSFAIGGWIAGAIVATIAATAPDGISPRIGMVVLAVAAISALPPLSRDVPPNLKFLVTATAVFAAVLDARVAAGALGGDTAMCVLGVLGGALIAVQSKMRVVDRWLLAAGIGTVVLNGRAVATAQPHSLSWVVIAAAGLGFLVRGFRSPADRLWAIPAGAASLALAGATTATAWHASQTSVGVVLALTAVCVLGGAALRRRQPEEFGLVAVAWAAAFTGIAVIGAQLHQHDMPYLAGSLALTGVAWLMFSALPERAVLLAPALVTLGAAQLCLLDAAVVRPVECLTVGLAILVVAASRAHRGKARAVTGVAGVAFGLLASALVSAFDPGLARPLATAAVAIVLVWFALDRANKALVDHLRSGVLLGGCWPLSRAALRGVSRSAWGPQRVNGSTCGFPQQVRQRGGARFGVAGHCVARIRVCGGSLWSWQDSRLLCRSRGRVGRPCLGLGGKAGRPRTADRLRHHLGCRNRNGDDSPHLEPVLGHARRHRRDVAHPRLASSRIGVDGGRHRIARRSLVGSTCRCRGARTRRLHSARRGPATRRRAGLLPTAPYRFVVDHRGSGACSLASSPQRSSPCSTNTRCGRCSSSSRAASPPSLGCA